MISLWLCFDIIMYLLCIFVCMQWCYSTLQDANILTYISSLGWCDSAWSYTLKSTVTQSLLFSDCTWSVSHSNSVHCLISEHILISVNITFCCVWYDLGNNILFYYDFLTAVFKLHISSILSYSGCRKGAYMYFCLALVSLASITRDLF